MYILLAIVLFGILIFVHELGHFMAAKLLGVRVNEFAICMGPAIWQKRVGETTYSLRCIPRPLIDTADADLDLFGGVGANLQVVMAAHIADDGLIEGVTAVLYFYMSHL